MTNYAQQVTRDQDDLVGSAAAEPARVGSSRRHVRQAQPRFSPVLGRLFSRSSWPGWAAFILTAAVFCLHIAVYSPLSPIDEIQHVDYAFHLMHGDTVVAGTHFSPEGEAVLTCRQIDTAPPIGMPCKGPYNVDAMPNNGYNTAYLHMPFYYAVPAVFGLVGKALGVPGDLVNVLRLSSVLWWALFVAVAWRLFRELDVNRWAGAAGIVLTGATPVLLHAYSIVNNDVTALPAGAAMTLGALLWDRGALRLRWLLVLAAAAVVLKATNIVVVVAVALFFLIRFWQRNGAPRQLTGPAARRTALAVAGLAITTVAIGAGWAAIASHRAMIDVQKIPMNQQFYASEFRPITLISSLDAFLSPIAPEFIDSVMASQTAQFVAALTNYGLMGLAILGAVLAAPGSRTRALAGACAVTAMFGSMIFIVTTYAGTHGFTLVTSRYGLSLVPMMLVVGLTSIRGKAGRVGIVVVGIGALLAMARVILV
jgi:hypothetical protein